ncbi:hypothetical protein E4K72_12845 [Oxalobacteraceae bacterium OM1]|nr:hypothetical protein E4K72_12845 [Oxalobacteraceae bacterium OM1]
MFFTVFGGAWIALWISRTLSAPMMAYVPLALVTLALFAWVYRVYALNRPALHAEPRSPEDARRSKLFGMVNGGQWVLIFILANVLTNLGHPDLVVPAAMFVIGAHFIPLALLFGYRPHFVTGAALMAVALLSPLLHAGSTAGPIGYLMAGLILWTSAFWSISSPRT